MNTSCRGCGLEKSFFTDSVRCRFKIRDNIEECPCTKCLVKVMCKVSCDLRSEKYIKMMEGTY